MIWVLVEDHAVWTLVEVVTVADLDVEIEALDNAVAEMSSKKNLTMSRLLKGTVVEEVCVAEGMTE